MDILSIRSQQRLIRGLILGSAIWLAKQMNLTEFVTAADELFHQRRIELWVVGNVPDHLQVKNRFYATRFLGFIDDLEPIFRSVRIGIVAERTGGGRVAKRLKWIDAGQPKNISARAGPSGC